MICKGHTTCIESAEGVKVLFATILNIDAYVLRGTATSKVDASYARRLPYRNDLKSDNVYCYYSRAALHFNPLFYREVIMHLI